MAKVYVMYDCGLIKAAILSILPAGWQSIFTPTMLTVMEGNNGEKFAIYEGSNDAAPGNYDVYAYMPQKEGKPMERAGHSSISIREDAEMVVIILSKVAGLWYLEYENFTGEPGRKEEEEQQMNRLMKSGGKFQRVSSYMGWEEKDAAFLLKE